MSHNITPADGGEGLGQFRPDLQDVKAKETVTASVVNEIGQPSATALQVAVQPTQMRHPWRSTARTVFAFVVGLAVVLPFAVQASGVDQTGAVVGALLAVAGGITRVMAVPQVEVFLRRFLPFLAATPKENRA